MLSASTLWRRWYNYSMRHGAALNNYDVLKLVALFAMIIDHAGFYLVPDETWMRVIGRIAFPIFMFLVGYSRQWRFDSWLLIAGLAITFSAWATHQPVFPLTILLTILLCRLILHWGVPRGFFAKPDIVLFIALLVWLIPMTIFFDYGSFALMYTLIGYWKRESIWTRNHDLFLGATLLLHTMWSVEALETGLWGTLAIIVIQLALGYNFRQFRIHTIALPAAARMAESTAVFIARNTLLIYTLHVIAFMIFARTVP